MWFQKGYGCRGGYRGAQSNPNCRSIGGTNASTRTHSQVPSHRRIQCVNSSSFPSPKRPTTGSTWIPYKYTDSVQLHFTNQSLLLAEGIHLLLRVRVQVRKRNKSQREVLRLNHLTIQVLADITARARPKKNEWLGQWIEPVWFVRFRLRTVTRLSLLSGSLSCSSCG